MAIVTLAKIRRPFDCRGRSYTPTVFLNLVVMVQGGAAKALAADGLR